MATASQWLAGTRPRTLPAAVVPVLIGSGVAVGYGGFSLWRGALGLIVGLALQVGVNYANDYSDGIRGTDAIGERVGPLRLVGSELAAPGQVKLAAFACFGVAAAVGLVLAAVTAWWLVPVGACCVLGAWCYTGGPRPYGYMGLGEVAVFVFFGLVAVAGAAFVEMRQLSWLGLAAAVPAGLLSCALLMINNLRDIKADPLSGKRTLAVRIGDARSRDVYTTFLLAPFAAVMAIALARPWALLALLALPLTVPPLRTVRKGGTRPALITALGQTSRLQIVFGIALTIGLAIHG